MHLTAPHFEQNAVLANRFHQSYPVSSDIVVLDLLWME
jgi:hypothetical protein